MSENTEKTTEAAEFDYHPMWESLGMDVPAHDMLLGAVGQMFGDTFLTQQNRPASTDYLNQVVAGIHSGRIKEMLDKKEAGEAKKIVGSFCLYVPEEIVCAAGGIPITVAAGAVGGNGKLVIHAGNLAEAYSEAEYWRELTEYFE